MARPADPTVPARLLAAAKEEFSESGVEGTKISAIANRAGVSKGAFYLHFKSKDEILEKLVFQFFFGMFAIVQELDGLVRTPSFDENGEGHVLDVDVRIMEYIWEERGFARVVYSLESLSKYAHLTKVYLRESTARAVRIVEAHAGKGGPSSHFDPELMGAFIAGGFHRYTRRLVELDEKPDIRAEMQQFTSFVYRGLTYRPVAQ